MKLAGTVSSPVAQGAVVAPGAWRAATVCFILLIAALPWTIAPMSILSIATAVLTLSLWLRTPRPAWPRTGIGAGWLAWTIALILACLFAQDAAASVPRLKKALFPALVALAAFHASDRRVGRWALAILFISSAVASVYGIGFFVAQGGQFPIRARGPVGHYMTFAGQLLLCLSVAVAVALQARERRWRLGALASAAIGTAALVFTYTRSSWIGFAVSLAVILGFTRPRWLLGLGLAGVAAYFAAPGSYRDRLHSAFDPHHPVNLERTYMWNAGLRMFRDHPWTGVGLEDLHPIYERYRLPQAHEAAGHLHSVPIQILATMGVIGLIAFIWLYASLFRATARGLRAMVGARSLASAVRTGVVAGLAGFAVAGLFEWNFGDEELLFLLFTLVGLACAARDWDAPLEAADRAPERAAEAVHA